MLIPFAVLGSLMAWYVVFRGRKPGLYTDWALCNEQVSGFKNASFKRYECEKAAIDALSRFFGPSDEADGGKIKSRFVGTNLARKKGLDIKNCIIFFQFCVIVILLYRAI